MIKAYRNISCLVTNKGLLSTKGVRPKEKDLGIITKAALVYSKKDGVLWVGKTAKLPAPFKKLQQIDCKEYVAYPGLVDSHTHPVFDSNRAKEFSMRMEGATYQEIAKAGGGILSSIKGTRRANEQKLAQKLAERIDIAHDFGVRLMEAKSGYGLSKTAEIKCLNVIKAQAKKKKVHLMGTCLSAHAIPPEYKQKRSNYIDLICNQILPYVAKYKLAQFCDAFCDEGYFTIEETRTIFTAAKNLGIQLRLHGDELANTESASLAVEMGALSVDHLLKVSNKGIKALANSNTVATLLPGTALFLKEPTAPARKLIDQGATVALASDFNPGSCTTQNLPLIGTLAALQMGMSTAEIIAGLTYNGAKALGKDGEFGTLTKGYKGEPVFCEGDHPAALFYKLAPHKLVNL